MLSDAAIEGGNCVHGPPIMHLKGNGIILVLYVRMHVMLRCHVIYVLIKFSLWMVLPEPDNMVDHS